MKLLVRRGNQSLIGALPWSLEMDFADLPFNHVKLRTYRSEPSHRSWIKSGVIMEALERRIRFNKGCELQNGARNADSKKQKNQRSLH